MNASVYHGLLLTEYFLTQGILDRKDAWRGLTYNQVTGFGESAETILERVDAGIQSRAEERKKSKGGPLFLGDGAGDPSLFNEAETELHIIFPLLESLGWKDAYAPQNPLGTDLPDVLLFPESRAGGWTKKQAELESVAVQENKRWALPLDSREGSVQAPSTQMLRYLTNAASLPGGKIRWGVLTNGKLWRLYSQDASSRSEEFLELDLWKILRLENTHDRDHWLRVFMLMFRREAFIPDPNLDGRTFHQYAVNEGRLWEKKITTELSRVLLEEGDGTLHILARGLDRVMSGDKDTPAFFARLREISTIVLFRLLFVLYAEDRRLLPVDKAPVSLRNIRKQIAEQIDAPRSAPFATGLYAFYDNFANVCRLIDRGDDGLKLPPYNGGLFDDGKFSLPQIPDDVFAPVVDSLSRWQVRGEKQWVNFRDLSVQHLGAVYEQLLEREFGRHPHTGIIQLRLSPYARKTGGSYYTPESLVRLIIERAVEPLTKEKVDAFIRAAGRKENSLSPDELRALDPAWAILNLKVCDPAMGSGHFLVSLADYIADRALEAIDRAEQAAPGYRSPLADQLAEMREQIILRAKEDEVHLELERLGDRLLMRRLVLKHAVYGVDKNPLAAELAKLSLWLHTFTVHVPLPFLDHHIRDGDSLFGEKLAPALRRAESAGGGAFAEKIRTAVRETADLMAKVENRADADIQESRESAADFKQFAEKSETVARFLSLLHAERWIAAGEKNDGIPLQQRHKNGAARNEALNAFFSGELGDPESILSEWKLPDKPQKCADVMRDILARAAELHSREKFLHWESAFSGVWFTQNGKQQEGGFDAIVGNPPWERMRMEEVEWFVERRPEIASAETANARNQLVEKLREDGDPLAKEYDMASQNIAIARQTARDCGDYPLLSSGDINLYSLFVERALKLIRPGGMIGLLTPSGIYADKTASIFFRTMSEAGRIAAIFDFENRAKNTGEERNDNGNQFFPAVDSRFKFCILILRGEKRESTETAGAFFLRDVEEVNDQDRLVDISPAVCALVNPNTHTSPIFRSRRDQNITLGIYNQFPAVRRHGSPLPTWPLHQLRMLDMTLDSEHFRQAADLEQDGYYRVAGNVYKRGEKCALPLYVGMMVHHFNHRAASVVVNPQNVFNPGQPEAATLEQLQDMNFLPLPRYWVDESTVNERLRNFSERLEWAVCFRAIARPNDARTIIAAIVPRAAVGNQLSLLLPDTPPRPQDSDNVEAMDEWRQQSTEALKKYCAEAPLYLANLCSFALDYVFRKKTQGANLNWFMMEQLPVIPMLAYSRKFGEKTAEEIIRSHVLELTFAGEDMRAFGRDMGYEGEPFGWDVERREELRSRLDALYFHLYGIGEEDVKHILSTFPIVERKDMDAHGYFRTRDMILEYMRALDAGDTDSRITPPPSQPKQKPKPKRKSKSAGRPLARKRKSRGKK